MDITGKTRVYTILAHPATHVTAPTIFNRIFEQLGLDMAYIVHDVPPYAIPDTIKAYRSWNNLGGFNVTIPHKKSVRTLVDSACPVTSRIGVVNTVVRGGDGTLAGYNTDGIGALNAVGDVHGATCLVMGAGGAARAIVNAFIEAGAGHIHIINRSEETARALLDIFSTPNVTIFNNDVLEEINIVVQTTPIVDKIPFDLDLSRLKKNTVVLETVMRPTALAHRAHEFGLKVLPGHSMLYHQTKKNLALFTGIDVSDEVIDRAFQSIGYTGQ